MKTLFFLITLLFIIASETLPAQLSKPSSAGYTDSVLFYRNLSPSASSVPFAQFTPDGKGIFGLISGNINFSIGLWNPVSGDLMNSIVLDSLSGAGRATSQAISIDGSTYALLNPSDTTMYVYGLIGSTKAVLVKKLKFRNDGYVLGFNPNNNDLMYAPAKDSVIQELRHRVWYDTLPNNSIVRHDTLIKERTIPMSQFPIRGPVFSPDKNRMVIPAGSGAQRTVKVYDAGTYNELRTIIPSVAFGMISFHPLTNHLYTTAGTVFPNKDTVIRIFDISTGSKVDSIVLSKPVATSSGITSVAIRNDGQRYAVNGVNDSLRIWNSATRTSVSALAYPPIAEKIWYYYSPISNRLIANGNTPQQNPVSYLIGFADSSGGTSSVPNEASQLPITLQIAPQPASSLVTMEYTLPTGGETTVRIMDELGKQVGQYSLGYQEAGTRQVQLDCSDYAQGRYYCQIANGNLRVTKAIVIAR